MVGNDSGNKWDYLGLADISIKHQRNTRDLFGVYGQLTVTIENSKLKSMMETGRACCRATNVGPYLTIELPPNAKRPHYLPGGTGISTPSRKDNDGDYGTHPNNDFDKYYTGLFQGRSGTGSLVKGSATSIANIIADYQNFKPTDVSDEDWADMVTYGISIGNGAIMIHLGDNSLWSGGCILIGTKYVAGTLNFERSWPSVQLDGVDSSVGEFFVAHFDHNDTANAQIQLTRMLWCAQKTLGRKSVLPIH